MYFTQVMDSSVTFIPSVVQTVAGEGKVDFIYLSDNFSENTTVQMKPSFIASADTVIMVCLMVCPAHSIHNYIIIILIVPCVCMCTWTGIS